VELLMDGRRAVLLATDPPYGVDFKGQKYNPTAKAWDAIEGDRVQGQALREWVAKLLGLWLGYVTEDFAAYLWTAAMAEGHRTYDGIIDAGLHVQGQIIWAKNNFAMGQADYQWKHEQAYYCFHKGKKHRWYGDRDKTTVWEIKRVASADYLHPMQKPVDLYKIPMENHTTTGELVAEPFSGSGTQIIAAEEMGRVCFAMELDPVYCDVAVRRWEEFTGRKAVLVRGEQ
jgi:DNA modification methylase